MVKKSASKKLLKASDITRPGQTGHNGLVLFYTSLLKHNPKSAIAREWIERASKTDPRLVKWLKCSTTSKKKK